MLAKDAAEPLREQLGLEKNAISDVPYKAYKVGTNPKLEESVLAKLRSENLTLDSNLEEIKAVLSRVVAPRKCTNVAIALMKNHLRKIESIHNS